LRAIADLLAQVVRQSRHQAEKELVSRLLGKRLEDQRMEVPFAGTPRGSVLDQLRPRQRQDEQRVVAGPIQQVFDEVEQRGVGPVQILEEQYRGPLLRHALEEEAPRGEQILLVRRGTL